MKIVLVSDAIYPYNKGGKEKRIFELSTRLARLGHDVHIYTMHWWNTPEKARTENGVHLHAISKKYELYHGDRRSITEGVLFALACFKLFTVKFDVIDVDHMPFFPIISIWIVCVLSFRRKKLFGTWHEALSRQDWIDYMGKSGIIASLIEHFSIKLPYRIAAASVQTARQLATYHQRTTRVDVVANGIDIEALGKVKPADISCDVLYVGRLVKDKNVDVLIKAMALLAEKNPEVHCVIVGHGIEKTNLEKLITTLRLSKQITMRNPLPDATDVYAYMKRAKVYVLPSVREGFGIVALEALGCGTPVITTDAPANAAKDLVENGVTGTIVRLNAPAVAEAIEAWTTSRPKGDIAKHVSGYAWDKIAKQQAEMYAS
jgi:glycosyltransferase involved in cell wall biosynthesis